MRRKNPVGNAAAIEPAGFRGLLQNGYVVADPRQLIGSAVTCGPRTDYGNFLSVGRAGLDHVTRQSLPKIAEKALDSANGNGFVVLAAVAGLLAGVITHAPRN